MAPRHGEGRPAQAANAAEAHNHNPAITAESIVAGPADSRGRQ
jgi:hypothetical protein